MVKQAFIAGKPILLALAIITIASSMARYYHDTHIVTASATTVQIASTAKH